jgi:myosin-1
MARRRVKRMRAVYTIINRYRRYKLRSYIVSIVRMFATVRQMPDLGRSSVWPVPPAVLKTFVQRLKKVWVNNRHDSPSPIHSQMDAQWRARQIVSRMPQHLRAAFEQKCAAFEAFKGRRAQWGYTRWWTGDYLALVCHISSGFL